MVKSKSRLQQMTNGYPPAIEMEVRDDKEVDLEVKFLTALAPYEKKDMEKCVRKICEKNKLTYDKQISISDNKQDLILGFREAARRLKSDDVTKYVCIDGQSHNFWLIYFFVRLNKDSFGVFFKNPIGSSVSEEIVNKLNEIFEQSVTIVVNSRNDIDRDNDNYYGPLTIRNLPKMLDMKWTDPNIIETFKAFTFATSEDVCRDKFIVAAKKAEELGTDSDFIKDLRNFVSKLPGKSKDKVEAYQKAMYDQLSDDKDKNKHPVDENTLEKLRNTILNDDEIKQLKKDQEAMSEKAKDENGVIKELKHNIQDKHESKMIELGIMFRIVDGCKLHYKKLKQHLAPIQTSLKMTEKELELLYETEKQQKEHQDKEKGDTDDANSEPDKWEKGVEKGGAVTPLKDILENVVIGMDRTSTNEPNASQEDLDKLKSIVKKVQDKTTVWENESAENVTNWAKRKKGYLQKDEDEVVEALGVMNRALGLDRKINMRDTQLVAIAVVLFLKKSDNAGTLCQVKTGEGKTVIVSVLAAIRCLQGYTVDVITSNIVLAQEGVDESRRFFKLMNLTAKVNNKPNSYTADILYGDISNYQFDYLRDLTEGTTIRKNRKFQQVILDEVDSMLVDNGGNIAKLSSSFPGMECLRYIYIKIWIELHKARESYAQEAKKIVAKFEEDYENVDETLFHEKYKAVIEEIVRVEKSTIRNKLSTIDPFDYPLIPNHLVEYCKSKKQTWIDNAIHAMYECHENEQYRICERYPGAKEKIVAPVDFSNTGVTMMNTVWSNGLHQFVQLKHNVELTFESLTSSFISNMGYIKLYPTDLIFGLTGTLGSTNEQKLLKGIYGVDFAKIPTYKPKIFKETDGLVVEDSSWDICVVDKVKEIIKADRPILVICETLKDLNLVKERLEKFKNTVGYKEEMRIFDDESNSAKITGTKLDLREVVLSTNLAGRGTNMKTKDVVEKKGGLHVCVTFLPCNVRVEEQAFGRTSRQGNAGTANLIVRQSEVVDKLGLAPDSEFKDIKAERDRLEQKRIATIESDLIPDLTFKDGIFGHFSRFCADLKKENNDPKFKVYMKDLKEWWAFWLEQQNFKGKELKTLDPKKQFERFKGTKQVIGITVDQQISHNPYYALQLADRFSSQQKPEEASKCLKRALELEPNGIAGAYLKLFEITIETSNQLLERCKDAVKELFGVDTKHSDFKDKVKGYLGDANRLIEKELNYNEKYLSETSSEFKKVVHLHSENSFLKHLHSRTTCIQVHKENINSLLKEQASKFAGFDFHAKVETNMEEFGKTLNLGDNADKYFTHTEAIELHGIGLDMIYSLKEIQGIDIKSITDALAFIGAGIAALVIGLLWLPSFPLMSNIAGTLISEGIVDIVMRVVTLNNQKYDRGAYMKGKFMKIGKALLSFGLGAVIQCSTILRKAVEFCRQVKTMLSQCTHFKEVCECVTQKLEAIKEFLQTRLDNLDFSRLTDAAKKIKLEEIKVDTKLYDQLKQVDGVTQQSRKALLTDFVKEVGKSTAKQLGVSVTNEFAIKPYVKNAMKSGVKKAIQQGFVQYFASCNDLKKKLKRANNYMKCINDYVAIEQKIFHSDTKCRERAIEFYQDHEKILGGSISDGNLEKLSEFARLVDAFANFFKDVAVIVTYRKGATKYLVSHLNDGSSDINVDTAIDEISTKAAEPVKDMIMKAWSDANKI